MVSLFYLSPKPRSWWADAVCACRRLFLTLLLISSASTILGHASDSYSCPETAGLANTPQLLNRQWKQICVSDRTFVSSNHPLHESAKSQMFVFVMYFGIEQFMSNLYLTYAFRCKEPAEKLRWNKLFPFHVVLIASHFNSEDLKRCFLDCHFVLV